MIETRDEAALTAYALGELEGDERAAVEARLASSEEARRELEEIRAAATVLRQALGTTAPTHELTAAQRLRIDSEARGGRKGVSGSAWLTMAASLVVAVVVGAMSLPSLRGGRVPAGSDRLERLPVAPAARFTSIEGTVKVKPVGQFQWRDANGSVALRKNDLVRTGAGSSAEITFFDGTVVSVRPDSLITIEETSEDPSTRRKQVRWRVDNGGVQFTVPAVPGVREVTTPSVRATAQEDSSGGIQVAQGGDTDVRLFRGSTQVVTAAGDRVTLGRNEAVRVSGEGRAAPKVSLPDAPELQSPPHDAEITYPDPTRATTLLTWKPVPGADAYHVQLDHSAHFSRPLVDRRGHEGQSVELRGLDAGRYYWRVSAVNREGVEGSFAPHARFSVSRAGGPASAGDRPPLRLEPLEPRGFIVQIKGSTEPRASVSVNNQRIEVQPDGTFNEFVTLGEPGRQEVVIRAVGLAGGVSEERRSVVVGY